MNAEGSGKLERGVLNFVGNTPLMELTKLCNAHAPHGARVFAKLEFMNPSGSIKDRMALHMTRQAMENGLLESKKIVEATSGNTGISFAMIAAELGFEFTAVMPEFASPERRALMKNYGAKVVLTPASESYTGAVNRARQIAESESAWFPSQYDNEDNATAHELTTGNEILSQSPRVDAFVAGVGTGGTLIGVARTVLKKYPEADIIGVEPRELSLIAGIMNGDGGLESGKIQHKHGIQGIGVGFVPGIFERNKKIVKEIITVDTGEAVAFARELASKEGLSVGISSGANACASFKAARRMQGGVVVTVLPDSSDRYYSTGLF